jgi:hypothetical protein
MYQENENKIKNKNTIIIITFVVLSAVVAIVFSFLIWRNRQIVQTKQANIDKKDNVLNKDDLKNNSDEEKEKIDKISTLSFNDQKQEVGVNEKFSLDAVVDPKGNKVAVADLFINFDPKVLKLDSITPSDNFSLIISDSKIDNGKGVASISLAIPMDRSAISESTKIATYNFQSVSSSGNTEVKFVEPTLIGIEGQNSNGLASTTPAVIILQE